MTRALEWMDRCDLDALIATSPVNVTYFTDYYCWLDPLMKEYMASPGGSGEHALPSYAVFTRNGEADLIVTALFATNASDLWVHNVRTYGSPNFDRSLTSVAVLDSMNAAELGGSTAEQRSAMDVLIDTLRSHGVHHGRIGIELGALPEAVRHSLVQGLSQADLRDCTNLIRLLRAVKTEDEVCRLTRAAEVAEEVACEVLGEAQSGLSMRKLSHDFHAGVAYRGAEFDHFAYGMRGMGIGMDPKYELQPGEVLYVDFGCAVEHCIGDSGRTLALVSLSKQLQQKYDALRAGITAGQDAMRPDALASTIFRAMRETMSGLGLTRTSPQGHGLGLEIRGYPIVSPDNGLRIQDDCVDVPSDLSLEPGMVVNLESAVFLPDVASLHIEQSYIVTPNGCRPLTFQDRETPFYPPADHVSTGAAARS